MTPLARRRLLWALPFLVFVLLVGLFAAGLQRDPRALPSQRVGQPAPAFSLPRLDDPAQRFAPADLKGQVWLLNVWASWCSACAQEHAAVTETSLMLHYAPELVHMDRMVEEAGATAKSYVRYPVRQGDVPAHGGLANPAGSSAERGRLIAEACVDAVAEICAEEFGE